MNIHIQMHLKRNHNTNWKVIKNGEITQIRLTHGSTKMEND